jgi:tellurite resistance protein TehA-like permease
LGHFGFSYVGLIYLLMLFIPNLIWAKYPPADYDAGHENKVLKVFERVGQVLVTCTVLIFENFNVRVDSLWSLWLLASFLLMILYEFAWIRYFGSDNKEENFYRSLLGIPVPLASLPVMGFMLLGVYGKVIWLIGSVILLGIGHIGIHIQHLREARAKPYLNE